MEGSLVSRDDAVSPVVGVVLMIVIVVLLATIIAGFILETEQLKQRDTPNAKFSFDYTGTNGDDTEGYVEIQLESGDAVLASELRVRGEGIIDATGTTEEDITSADTKWGSTSAFGPQSELTGGEKILVGVESDYDITVVWSSNDVDKSVVLVKDEGPDAT